MSRRAITKMQSIIIAAIIIVAGVGAALYYMTRPSPAVKPIKIGYIGNLAWPIAETAAFAARLAADEINDAGGILGKPVRVIVEDSKGEVPTAVAAYKKLVMTDRVLSVIVGEGSELNFACQEAGAELYPEYPHLCANPCTSHLDLTKNVVENYDKYKFYFRPFINTTDYFAHLRENTQIMIDGVHPETMALIMEDALWTKIFREGLLGVSPPFKDVLEEMGLEVVYYTETAVGEKMFFPIFEEVAAAKPDYIHFLGAYTDDATLVKQWATSAAKDIDLYIQGGLCQIPGYWEMTGGGALGVVTSYYAAKAEITEKTIPYMEGLERHYGRIPNWVCSGTYDWIHMLKAAIEEAKTADDVEALIETLEEIEIVSVGGIRKFWPKTHSSIYGFVGEKMYLTDIRIQYQRNGELIVVWPYDVAERTNPGRGVVPVKELRAG